MQLVDGRMIFSLAGATCLLVLVINHKLEPFPGSDCSKCLDVQSTKYIQNRYEVSFPAHPHPRFSTARVSLLGHTWAALPGTFPEFYLVPLTCLHAEPLSRLLAI